MNTDRFPAAFGFWPDPSYFAYGDTHVGYGLNGLALVAPNRQWIMITR